MPVKNKAKMIKTTVLFQLPFNLQD